MAKAKVEVVGSELGRWVLAVVMALDQAESASAQSVTFVHPIGLVFRVLSNIAPNEVPG